LWSTGSPLEPLLSQVGVVQRPRPADLRQDLGAVALGQQVSDIPFLVAVMATSP
jgi:hypothetical protein